MKTIIPINITALRVSSTDATNIVTGFKGRMAAFDRLPFQKNTKKASTGDAILQPLESNDSAQSTLREGIHLHWELPDRFKKGTQSSEDGKITFPQVPNRWLVTRYLRKYDTKNNQWLPPIPHSWIVESDFISESQQKEKDGFIRASVPVPLPVNITSGEQPYRYMGRVVDSAEWGKTQPEDKYLKDFTDADGHPYYLHAIGFLGPAFSSYYPDCCSVFGFHDRFTDDTEIYNALRLAYPILFKASYHIIGWIEGASPYDDPEISGKVICNGIIQEIVWDMLSHPGARNFLGNPSGNISPSIWEDNNVRLSIGNTSSEALAALLSTDISARQEDNVLENNYEYLLNMLQSGRIEEIDKGSNLLSKLEKGLHSDGFASEQGGLKWVIQKKEQSGNIQDPTKESHLPLSLYRKLKSLNEAQKEYDTLRGNLEAERKQFFMDWYRYIKMYVEGGKNYHFTLSDLSDFVECSFDYITVRGENIGILHYTGNEDNGIINGVQSPEGSTSSKARFVWMLFQECCKEIATHPEWELMAVPADIHHLPTDPVAAIEMDSLHCKMRNGDMDYLPVRTATDVLDRLIFTCKSFTGVIEGKEFPILPIIKTIFPDDPDMWKLVTEPRLILPSFASEIASILKNKYKGVADNPATENEELFITDLTTLLGGGSSVDAPTCNSGLFNAIREKDYQPVPNQSRQSPTSPQLTVTFTNTENRGWLMHPLGWNTQEHLADLNEKRHDPFLPLSIIWEAKLEPIKRDREKQNYGKENLTRYFSFNAEATDYTYSTSMPFVDGKSIKYTGSSILMKKAIKSLTNQMEKYAGTSDSNSNEEIESTIKGLKERKIISQTLSGFNSKNLLRNPIPPMPLVNLTKTMDFLTNRTIRKGLTTAEEQGDSWYAGNFHYDAPISVGPYAQTGFCPLRSGFLSIESLEIVDVFGQRMRLYTPQKNADNSLQLQPSVFLSPIPDDKEHRGKAYLPPRLLTPSRLHFKWLDADADLTTPACGWILPNHLDHSLFFYNHDGKAVGSFGIEHHALIYRTRAGNRENPSDYLETDIGSPEAPKVNPWLGHFMRYINSQNAVAEQFFAELMQVILDSENFINPETNTGDGSLAVLIGRPLAITRIALEMETYGASLPLCQSAMSVIAPFTEDVNKGRFSYNERMPYGDAGLSHVQIPVKLGNPYNINDGLIGYIRETGGRNTPYETEKFYAPSADSGQSLIVPPSDTHLLLNLNAGMQTLTLLIDPRASVHASTGLLPVKALEFPPDDFAEAADKLQMTFFTHPLLQQKLQFTVLLPEQKEYTWAWVTQHQDKEIPLPPPYSQQDISWGYSPQRIEEGWLKLSKEETVKNSTDSLNIS